MANEARQRMAEAERFMQNLSNAAVGRTVEGPDTEPDEPERTIPKAWTALRDFIADLVREAGGGA